jgi:glutaredoxin
MSAVHLYCQGACAACSALRRPLVAHGIDVETHDVTTDPRAYDTATALGYRSLPVLVGPGGSAAADVRAGTLAWRLTSRAQMRVRCLTHCTGAPVDVMAPPPAEDPMIVLRDRFARGRSTSRSSRPAWRACCAPIPTSRCSASMTWLTTPALPAGPDEPYAEHLSSRWAHPRPTPALRADLAGEPAEGGDGAERHEP